MERTILLEGRAVTYRLQRKSVKNINLRIRGDTGISVSADPRVPMSVIEDFLRANASKILRIMDDLADRAAALPPPKRYVDGEIFYVFGETVCLSVCRGMRNRVTRDGSVLQLTVTDPDDVELKRTVLLRWMQNQCKKTITPMCERVYQVFRGRMNYPVIRFHSMRSQWGNCQPKRGILTFNFALSGVPLACVEYVVFHEWAHFLHPDHSPAFYERLSQWMPDWKVRKEALEQAVYMAQYTELQKGE